jgi:hypothetical protein
MAVKAVPRARAATARGVREGPESGQARSRLPAGGKGNFKKAA